MMKQLINFTKDESGAVTVDWVVLTAAIVGIAIAVIGLISGGISNAASSIDDTLRSAGVGWSFEAEGASTIEEYVNAYFESGGTVDPYDVFEGSEMDQGIRDAIIDNAPDGYEYNYQIDTATGTPVYENDLNGTYSIDGNVINQADYDLTVSSVDQVEYFDPAT